MRKTAGCRLHRGDGCRLPRISRIGHICLSYGRAKAESFQLSSLTP